MRITLSIFVLLVVLISSCSTSNQLLDQVNTRFDNPGEKTKLSKGMYWYSWLGFDKVLNRNTSLNIVDIDLAKAEVEFDFAWFNASEQRATLSEVADTSLAIVAVNSAYFEKLDNGGFVSFHKSSGKVDQYCELPNHTPGSGSTRRLSFRQAPSPFPVSREHNDSTIAWIMTIS